MAAQTVDFYSIRTLTNLHAGSGDTAYGIVDNMVQRDPVSKIPVVHASSLKGALRQYFTENAAKDNAGELTAESSKQIRNIFGGDTSPRNKGASGDDFSAGSHLFFEARLLVLPARSDRRPFFRAICPELVQEILASWKTIGFEPDPYIRYAFAFIAGQIKDLKFQPEKGRPIILTLKNETTGFGIEHWDIAHEDQIKTISTNFYPDKNDQNTKVNLLENAEMVFGENIVLFHIDDFKNLCNKLPVIARNQLENGISQNLFYEEVVPRESRFFSFIVRPTGDNSFVSKMKDTRVQVGANATIGYGQCKFFRYISESKPQTQTA